MIINHNISALNTHRQLSNNNNAVQNSLEKLSSGLQINKAADDAAGLAISEKMRGQIRGLEQAQNNAQDGISLIQTAEGALSETQDILQRMRELAVQSSNDTNTDEDRGELQKELDQLSNALNDISENTEFNTKKLLDGSVTEGFTFHVGANSEQNLSVSINKMDAEALGVAGEEMSTKTIDTDYLVSNTRGEEVTIAYTAASTDENGAAVENSSSFDKDSNTLTITLAQDKGDGNSAGSITATKDDVLAAINSVDGLSATFADGVTGTSAATVGSGGDVAVSTATGVIDPDKGINISSQKSADAAITTIQTAIDDVSAERSKLGAVQNRLDHTINNLGASAENLTAAESRIRDVDYDSSAA